MFSSCRPRARRGTGCYHRLTRPSRHHLRPGLIAILLALTGCAGTMQTPQDQAAPPAPTPADTPAPFTAAERLAEAGRYAAAAQAYLERAEGLGDAQAGSARLRAAQLLLLAGERERAQALVTELEQRPPADAAGRQRLALLQADLALIDNRAPAVITLLEWSEPPANTTLAAARLDRLAQAQQRLGEPEAALGSLMRRRTLLGEIDEAETARVWQLLQAVEAPDARTGLDAETSGWRELAVIWRNSWQGPERTAAAIADWQRRYRSHPGQPLAAEMTERLARRGRVPDHIALLLPLSGRYGTAAAAVRDGFLAAQLEAETQGTSRSGRTLIYDAGEDAATTYREAVAAGAQWVVGPLTKEAVGSLAGLERLPVPVLALNEADGSPPAGLYQFTLSPDAEARLVAEKIHASGQYRTRALVPENDWGERLLAAFTARYEALGGQLVAARRYDTGRADHGATLRALLKDAGADDAVFLAAFPDQARGIVPQIRYHGGDDLPIYATSHVYGGTPSTADRDLEGVRFPDMPWSLEPDRFPVTSMLQRYWQGSFAERPRLYALGYDAYGLTALLDGAGSIYYYPGATGMLSSESNRVQRSLPWGVFRSGRARPWHDGSV